MNVHLIIILKMFFGRISFTHKRGRLFNGEGADLTCSMSFALMSLFKICTFISMICFIYQISKHRRLIFRSEKLDHRVKKKIRMCVFVCVGGVLTIFYSPQATMKMVWNPLPPQINITEECESLCIRQIIFGNPPESKWALT